MARWLPSIAKRAWRSPTLTRVCPCHWGTSRWHSRRHSWGMPRVSWPIGRIEKLHESSVGETRSATIQLSTDRTVRRSLCHVYPLECPSTPAQVSSEPEPISATEPESSSDHTGTARPKRQAAACFQEQLDKLIQDGASTLYTLASVPTAPWGVAVNK